jgi:hypothetical protein
VTLAEDVLAAIGSVPVPMERVTDSSGSGYRLGAGFRPLMEAYDAAKRAVEEERTQSQDSQAV